MSMGGFRRRLRTRSSKTKSESVLNTRISRFTTPRETIALNGVSESYGPNGMTELSTSNLFNSRRDSELIVSLEKTNNAEL